MVLVSVNHLIALLALVLALAVFMLLKRYGVPDKICWGASILSILVVSIFWTSVLLGADDDDDD